MRAIKQAGLWLYRFAMRRKLLTACIVVAGVLAITPIIIITRTWFIVHTDARPAQTPGPYTLEEQTEGFTCGVHSLSTVYRAYGLDPEAERIRWRLGVDTKAVAWMPDSTGALHPDLWMVLAQDFFEIDSLDLTDSVRAWTELRGYVADEGPAILLIKRRENGNLHWVVATRPLGDAQIEIYDSLFPEPYEETADFLADHIVTAVLVRPTPDGDQAISSIDAHLAGMDALSVARKRINALEDTD